MKKTSKKKISKILWSLTVFTFLACSHAPPPAKAPATHIGDPAKEKILFDQGFKALSKSDYKTAATKFTDLITQYPTTSYFHHAQYNLGLASEGLGKYPEAAQQYKSVAEFYQGTHNRDEVDALYRLSICYEVANDDPKVILTLLELQNHTALLGHDIADVELPARLAAAYARQGNHEQAESYFSKAEVGLKRLRALHPKGDTLLWLPKTLYSMGHLSPPQKDLDPKSFENYLTSLVQTQEWLVQAAELGDNSWSKKAAEDLINIYFASWDVVEKHPTPSLPDKLLALKTQQEEQKGMAVNFDKAISKLKLERIPPSPLEPEASRLKTVFNSIDVLQKQNDALLQRPPVQDQPTVESQQREGLKRQGVIKEEP